MREYISTFFLQLYGVTVGDYILSKNVDNGKLDICTVKLDCE